MAVNSIFPPFPQFVDNDGTPLENGFIYIGQPGFEARTTPKASFFDVGQTIPTGTANGSAVRTMAGLPVNTSGAPAMIYVDGDYSISVTDRNGVLLYSTLYATVAIDLGGGGGGDPILGPDGTLGAVGIGFTGEPNTGFVRPSAGTLHTSIAGALAMEATATFIRAAVPMRTTVSASVTAGTNAQGQAVLASDNNVITTAAANPSGATLPAALPGMRVMVANQGANPVNLYPASGATINALAVNVPISLPVGSQIMLMARSATQWDGQVVVGVNGILTTNGDLLTRTGGVLARLPITADQYVKGNSAGTALEYGTPGRITWENVVATSGAGPISVSTTIPTTATEIYFALLGCSLSGSDNFIVQLGTASTWITSGYDAIGTVSGGASGGATASNGALVFGGTAARAPKGVITFYKTNSGNAWVWTVSGHDGINAGLGGGGTVTTTDPPTRIRIDASGSNTFDAGNVRVGYL